MENREERLIELITELWEIPNEERTQEIFEEVNRLSPDPEWSSYIFYSEEFIRENEVLDIAGVVEKILSFKAIRL